MTTDRTADGLALETVSDLDRSELEAWWRRIYRRDPPPRNSRELMVRAVSYHLQKQRHGGLDRKSRRRLEQQAAEPAAARTATTHRMRIKPGTRLIREWHGEVHDVLVLEEGFAFRGDNEASNPITIFEFKKPQRDDFVNPSSKEDPVDQIIRYVNRIREGKYKTPKGREIMVAENTPFYGYVVCDITAKVESWLEREKDFTPMPDRRGWYNWFGNIKLYVEVLSWEKILKDAAMRNKVFFHTLGIE